MQQINQRVLRLPSLAYLIGSQADAALLTWLQQHAVGTHALQGKAADSLFCQVTQWLLRPAEGRHRDGL